MNHSIKSRIVAALLVGLSATSVGYAAEPAISTVKQTAVESTENANDVAHTDDKTTVEAAGTDAAESVAYIDNAPIKAVKIDTKTKKESTKTGWLAEQMAVTEFGDSIQFWQAASENEGPLPSVTQNNLADIGKSYTANNLPALGSEDDYAIDG
ncbi:MAG: hypothetical protein E6963_03000, partial [Veillonella sp.]|nr:hypothetical protein [Veillonella sp.]